MKPQAAFGLVLALVTLALPPPSVPPPGGEEGGGSTTVTSTAALYWEPVLPDLRTRIWRSPWYETDRTLFVTTGHDLRRTTDDGNTWTTLYPTPPLTETTGVTAVAFDPAAPAPSTLFVAHIHFDDRSEVYRSTDDGVTWSQVLTTTDALVLDLVAVRNSAGQLVVFAIGGGAQVWRSTDGGDTWSPAAAGLPGWAQMGRIFASPAFATDGTLYATGATAGDCLLARSTDGGDTWAEVDIPQVDVARQVVFSPQYAADGTLWISYSCTGGERPFNGVVRSTDYGDTWQVVSAGLDVDFYDGYILGLAASPDYPEDPALYAVQMTMHYVDPAWDLYRSPASGDTWWAQGPAPAEIPRGLLVADRDLIFLPSGDGLWRLRTTCWEWVVNGGCERATDWRMPDTPAPADYVTDPAHGDSRSIRVGIIGQPNRYAYSSAQQRVSLPETALDATLSFWLYPVSTETQVAASDPEIQRAAAHHARPSIPARGDAQYVLILDEEGARRETLLWTLADSDDWELYTFDLSAYLGETIWLHFGVYNDGAGGITGMVVDDVSLTACEPPPSRPSPASQVNPLAPVQTATAFTVTWSGTDAGWGIAGYDVQVRDGDAASPWTTWLSDTTTTSAVFGGQDGHTYAFRSRAWDSLGNLEAWPANKWQDTFTTVLLEPAPVLVTSDKVAQPLDVRPGDRMEFQIHLRNTGNLAASVQVTDPLPANLALASGPWSNLLPDPAFISNTVAWSGTLAAGQDGSIGFEAWVLDVPPGRVVTNAAWIDDGVHSPLRREVAVRGWRPVYLPLILQSWQAPTDPPAGPLLIDGERASRVVGDPHSATIYALTPRGLHRSDDGARTWVLMTPSPPVTQTLVLAPGQPDVLYAGAGYPCYAGGPDVPMWKSVDDGQTWFEVPAGRNLEPLAVHPADARRVYARGCDGPWRSTDGGDTWNPQADELFLVYDVRHVAPALADDWQTVYLGCATEGGGGGVIGSRNGGTDWELLTPLGPSPWWVSVLAVDPISPTHVYFGEPNAFWSSADGGTTWFTSTAGLEGVVYNPGGPITQTYGLLSLAYTPADLNGWLLGTVHGLYGSLDRGQTWTQLTGPPWQDEQIDDLLLRQVEPDKLFVTTPGGAYVYYLDAFP
jgi:uncharacterized repeat protein (TIGR01451 family)